MAIRIKYPLTEGAKEAARELVRGWDADNYKQLFSLITSTLGDDDEVYTIIDWTGAKDTPPRMSLLFELAEYKLITLTPSSDDRWNVFMLQELRNAVESDFEVSDYFLTTSTVGTIINLGEGASASGIQSIAVNYGTAIQNVQQLSDRLIDTLGMSLLEEQKTLREAIEALRTARSPEDTKSKVGKVIEELGRCLVHIGNAGAAIEAIILIGQFIKAINI